MTPSLPIPTDNIYKFACLFGLTLIVVSVFSYVAVYTSSLDRKVKYSEAIIPLEAKKDRSKAEEDVLSLNKRLLEITRSNESTATNILTALLIFGTALSAMGAALWHSRIQKRDDRLAELQIRKLEAEIANLEGSSQSALSSAESLAGPSATAVPK